MSRNRMSVEIRGSEHFSEVLSQFTESVQTQIDEEVSLSAIEVRNKAIRNITRQGIVDQGFLRSSMVVVKQGRDYYVMNTAYYSPFIEFGTGVQINVPAEWTAYASSFKHTSRGTFEQFVQALVEWAKRKGIQVDDDDYENFAFWVAIKILQNGQEAKPFFYPAYDEVRTALLKRIKLIVKQSLT
jgi:hypothetical protein